MDPYIAKLYVGKITVLSMCHIGGQIITDDKEVPTWNPCVFVLFFF